MGFRTTCKKIAKDAIKDVVATAEASRAGPVGPQDPQAYADEVAATIKGEVRMISGCMDCQYSQVAQDVSELGAGGACVAAMLIALNNSSSDNTWLSLLKGMREILAQGNFEQIPQLSTSNHFDIHEDFYIVNPSGSGKTRSLLIGIQYTGQQGQLPGCHNDVTKMKEFIETYGFERDETSCLMLMDDGLHAAPDRDGMINGFRWLVRGAEAGDSLFMLYSGHGGSVEDTSGDEVDGMDETLCPVDYQESGMITDDEIFEELVLSLPEGVTLTVVMDSCHSGSVLHFPYAIQADEGTIAAVESGEQSAIVGANPTLSKIILYGKKIYDRFKSGDKNACKVGSDASAAASH